MGGGVVKYTCLHVAQEDCRRLGVDGEGVEGWSVMCKRVAQEG